MPDLTSIESELAAFLVIIAALLFIYNQVRAAMGKAKLPQPLEISLTRRFVERPDFDDFVKLNSERHRAAKDSRDEMKKDLQAMTSRTTRLEEQNKAQTDSINLLRSDIREYSRENRQSYKELLDLLRKKDSAR